MVAMLYVKYSLMKAGNYKYHIREYAGSCVQPKAKIVEFFELLDDALAKLLCAGRLVELGGRWLTQAYYDLKDNQHLWDAWLASLESISEHQQPEEEGGELQMRLKSALAVAKSQALQLSREADEARLREDCDLCTIRGIQLDWLDRQRRVVGPRRLRKMQAAKVAECSFRKGLQAKSAASNKTAREKKGDSANINTSESEGSVLTVDKVLSCSKEQLVALAMQANAGQKPWGSSRWTKAKFLAHVLAAYGLETPTERQTEI
eukprot:scaffold42317_cov27-Prasinocladus_malaysianus.AAC.4